MKASTLTINTTTVPTECSILVIHLRRNLDGENYTQLISAAQELYDKNHRKLILDLAEVQKISMAGLFALHSVAAIFNGQEPLNGEDGWQAMRAMKHDLDTNLQPSFKLSSPQPQVRKVLAQSGFDTFIAVFDDLPDAADSFTDSSVQEMVLPPYNVLAHVQHGASRVSTHHYK